MHSVLLVDDDRAFSPLVKEYLEAKGFRTELKHNADDGLAAFRRGGFDICVLDVKMPMKDGFALAQDIRSFDPHMPILFLTGQTDREDRIKGLALGADDYVTKPFSLEELFLRIQAIMRRVKGQSAKKRETAMLHIGAFSFNPAARELRHGERLVKLTAIESKLLLLFLESGNGVISRDAALRQIWGDDDLLRGRSLNVYVSKLRSLLRDDPRIGILNVHGEGYQLVIGD